MTDAETKTIVGQCVSIDQKPGNDWVEFKVNVGSQYPVKLSTKVEEIIRQGREVGSEVAAWTFKESQGKENPNRPGTYFMNRYLSKVELATEGAPQASGGTPVPEAHHDAIAPADKDRTITRQACLKAAASLYANSDQEDPALAVMKAAQRFEQWVYRDIDDPPSKPGGEQAQADPGEYEPGYAPADSIPFGDEPQDDFPDGY